MELCNPSKIQKLGALIFGHCLNTLFREKRPFLYILETNTYIRERATYAKRDHAAIDEAASIIGDIAHNLQAALDHAYWKIVSPFIQIPKEKRAVQFPFTESAAKLEERAKKTFTLNVSPAFLKAVLDLKPHGEPDGNELLYLIHEIDIIDKHQAPIPTGSYTQINSETLRPQIPDLPAGIFTLTGRDLVRDVGWKYGKIDENDLGASISTERDIFTGGPHIFEKELDVPVDIVFSTGAQNKQRQNRCRDY
jgi:hypothetical protein